MRTFNVFMQMVGVPLFALGLVVLLAIAVGVTVAVLPNVPPPCSTPPNYSALPSGAAVGSIVFFWLGGLIHHRPQAGVARPPRTKPNGVPVFLVLTLVLLVVALLLGYEVYAVISGVSPDPTITHYVRCAYGSGFTLPGVASVAGAWAVCLILGHWFAYDREGD